MKAMNNKAFAKHVLKYWELSEGNSSDCDKQRHFLVDTKDGHKWVMADIVESNHEPPQVAKFLLRASKYYAAKVAEGSVSVLEDADRVEIARLLTRVRSDIDRLITIVHALP